MKGMLTTRLSFKLAVIGAATTSALLNQFLAPVPIDGGPYAGNAVKAAGFTFIAAIILFAALIPTGYGKKDKEDKKDKYVDYFARVVGVGVAFGAGWHSLEIAMNGKPGVYIVFIVAPFILVAFYLLVAGLIIKLVVDVGKDLWGLLTELRKKKEKDG